MIRIRNLLTTALVAAVAVGCSAQPAAAPMGPVVLGATTGGGERPIDGSELVAETPYHFADVLPGVLDVDLTITKPPVFAYSGPSYAYLTGDSAATTDVLTLLAATDAMLPAQPLRSPPPGSNIDLGPDIAVTPDELLPRLAGLPFLQVTAAARPVTVAGQPATAVDVRVPPLPPEAETCWPGSPPCANLVRAGDFGHSVVAGQELRLALVDHPMGPVLVIQNLQEPRAQPILDGLRFAERSLPAELAPARPLPYTAAPLDPGQVYGAALPDAGVGVAFAVGTDTTAYAVDGKSVSAISTDLPPELREPAPFGYIASTEKLFGYVAASADLLVPEPGVDPRTIGPGAFARSAGATGGAAGLVDLVAAQPWAEVVSGPVDASVGGVPGRSVDVRLALEPAAFRAR